MLKELLAVFAFGMIGLWEGPLGFVLHLPPITIALVSALGSTTATVIVRLLGEGTRRQRGKTARDNVDRIRE